MTRQMLIFAAVLAALATTASAEDDLKLVAREVREVLWQDLYAVAVWSHDGELSAEDIEDQSRPKVLALEVVYEGSLPEIPESWSHELRPELDEEQWQLLRDSYEELSTGETIFVSYRPEGGTRISRNGQVVLRDEGYGLMKGFFDIWFGEDPISDDFRAEFIEE
jgi:hypothetical protein